MDANDATAGPPADTECARSSTEGKPVGTNVTNKSYKGSATLS